ncbi:MAG: lyase family protein [Bacteroidota bacterium]
MYSQYLSDEEVSAAMSDQAFIHQFCLFESQLAVAQAALGIIPASASDEIQKVLIRTSIRAEEIQASFLTNGIPTIGLLNLIKKQLSESSKPYLHYKCTSQDVIDTAHMLMYRAGLGILETRILHLLDLTHEHIQTYGNLPLVARTRNQQAGPIVVGVRLVNWMNPLLTLLEQLTYIRDTSLNLQFAGAFGTNAALGAQAHAVAIQLAEALELGYIGNWHTNRLPLKSISDWLVGLSGSVGKIAKDILFLSANEVGEMKEDGEGGGKSSAMPHKSNPILSEAILALSMENSIEAIKINQAMMHLGERDGAAWIMEWRAMVNLFVNSATCLTHLVSIMKRMVIHQAGIRRNLRLIPAISAQLSDLPHSNHQQIIDTFIEKIKNLHT